MDNKALSTLEKVRHDRSKGNYDRALKRLGDALRSYPDEVEIYQEAADTAIDAGESIQGIQFLKQALARFPSERAALIAVAREKEQEVNDPILAKFLLEFEVKRRAIDAARAMADGLHDRTARDLLQRTRMKRQSLSSAAHGGHSVSNEIFTNRMSEVLLCLRLARTDEALNTLSELLDGHRDEAENLEPLLAALGGEPASSGRAMLLHARCKAMISHHQEATERLVDAVARDPSLGPEALDLLREMSRGADAETGAIDHPLVKILLITGEHARVVELLRPRIERYPDAAGEILSLVGPFTEGEGNDPVGLRLLYLDAALAADQRPALNETIATMRRDDSLRDALLEWLEERSRDRFFAPEIMKIHAELALESERFDRAAEILRAIARADATAAPEVLKLIGANAERSPQLAALSDELATPEAPASSENRGAGFEEFQNKEFRFSSDAGDTGFEVEEESNPPSPVADDDQASEFSDFDIYDGSSVFHNSAGADQAPSATGAETGKEPVADAAENGEPPGEEFVRNVAQSLYDSGARTFFHVESEDDHAPTGRTDKAPAPAADAEETVPVVAELADAPAPEAHAEETVPVVAELADAPAPEAHAEETAPVAAEPADAPTPEADAEETAPVAAEPADAPAPGADAEETAPVAAEPADRVAVRLREVDAELAKKRAREALGILQELRGENLSKDERRTIYLKTVECHRVMGDYHTAHRTLVDLIGLYPGDAEIERLAKHNYEQYLGQQCNDTPVLEKVTSLDSDQ